MRSTHSLPRKLVDSAEAYRALHPEVHIKDFSALLAAALAEYLEKHHPGLIAETVREIRMIEIQLAAEPKPKPPDKLKRTTGAGPRIPVSKSA